MKSSVRSTKCGEAQWLLICCLTLGGVSLPVLADSTRAESESADEDEKTSVPESVRAERMLRSKPNDADQRLEVARAYLAEADSSPSKREVAARHVQHVLAQAPNNPQALLLMGQIELQRDRPAVAAVHLQNAVRVAPDDATVQLVLGDALSRLGDEAGATKAFDEYRRIMGTAPPPANEPINN